MSYSARQTGPSASYSFQRREARSCLLSCTAYLSVDARPTHRRHCLSVCSAALPVRLSTRDLHTDSTVCLSVYADLHTDGTVCLSAQLHCLSVNAATCTLAAHSRWPTSMALPA
jgi:hypothetical protein